MGIGRILGAAAPIAAGYFTGGAGLGFGTGAQIAAGAATGAGIAALSGQDALTGAFTGGLGGMSGGSLAKAFNPATSGIQSGLTTGQANKTFLEAATPGAAESSIGVNVANASSPGVQLGDFVNSTSTLPLESSIGAGTSLTDIAAANPPPTVDTSFSAGLDRLGGGNTAMGMGKLGIMGLGVAGGAGAFDPEPVYMGPSEDEKYDPRRRLDLSMDTGIDEALNRDSGLRLIAQGGHIKKYQVGGPLTGQPQEPPPKYGIIDVGGQFVETSDKPGPGLISDKDFKEQYQTTTAQQNQQSGGGGGMDTNLAPGGQGADDKGLNPGALAAIASGFAQQQMNPPTKSQTLGLESLAGGGYLETGGEVGDGMSDEIEATIEGTQEARLSDGEFVIPADVVSHLGNGSSDAGARRLYEMMDKVRMARTGNKKQGKEIKAENFMPK